MSEPYRGRRAGRSDAFPNLWARQSHPRVEELDPTTTTTRHSGDRASCFSLDSTSASCREALFPCLHTSQLTRTRPPFQRRRSHERMENGKLEAEPRQRPRFCTGRSPASQSSPRGGARRGWPSAPGARSGRIGARVHTGTHGCAQSARCMMRSPTYPCAGWWIPSERVPTTVRPSERQRATARVLVSTGPERLVATRPLRICRHRGAI